MNIINQILHKDFKEQMFDVPSVISIKKGDVFALKVFDDPFPKKPQFTVLILDVQSGWVRYSFQGSYPSDERMELESFLGVYERAS